MKTNWIIDIAMVVLLAYGMFIGYKKGVIRSLVSILCTVAAFAASWFISTDELATQVYDEYFSSRVESILSDEFDDLRDRAKKRLSEIIAEKVDAVEDFVGVEVDDSVKDKLGSVLSGLYEYASEKLDIPDRVSEVIPYDKATLYVSDIITDFVYEKNIEYAKNDPFMIKRSALKEVFSDADILQYLVENALGKENKDEICRYVEQTYLRPKIVKLLRAVLCALIFGGIRMVMALVTGIVSLILKKSKPLREADKAVGCALGFAGSALIIALSAYVIAMIINITEGTVYINNDIISQTLLFRYVYDYINGLAF